MNYAKNLPHNSLATCLRGIADDLRQRMRQNRKRLPRAGLLQEKRQIERAAETESVPAHDRGIGQGHVGEALEQHGQQDDANGSPRQVRARAMMRAVAKGQVRIGLAQPVVVLAIYKHGRYTEEVQATRRWLREAPSRYQLRQPETCTFSSSIGRRLPIPSMIFLKHS